jgi:hypothetical protein
MFSGFEPTRGRQELRRDLGSDFILALLLHEKLCVEFAHLSEMIELFGFQDVSQLLQNRCLEVILDKNFQPVVMLGDKGIQSGTADSDNDNRLEKLQKYLEQSPARSKDQVNRFINLTLDNAISLEESEKLSELICREVDNDLRNTSLRKVLGMVTEDRQKISPPDIYRMLQLFHINHGLAYSCEFKTATLITDATLGNVWQAKLTPLLQRYGRNSTEVFRSVLHEKEIPDPSGLYFDGIVTMHDILALREDVNGRRFREWLSSTDYNSTIIKEALEIKRPWTKSSIIKAVRWVTPKILGTLNPVAGSVASWLDSYVLDKFLQGWHPNFFLDDKLKAELDTAIQNHDRALRASRQPPW